MYFFFQIFNHLISLNTCEMIKICNKILLALKSLFEYFNKYDSSVTLFIHHYNIDGLLSTIVVIAYYHDHHLQPQLFLGIIYNHHHQPLLS